MLATRWMVLVLVFVVVRPAAARAAPGEAAPADGESGVAAKAEKRPGSHFLAEGSAGFGIVGASGVTRGGMFGAGGRVPGSPLRLYLVGEIAQSENEGRATTSAGSEHLRYEAMDAGLGLRGYLPLYGRLRFFADAMFGRTLTTITQDTVLARTRAWTNLFALAAGLQLRVIDELSCGVRTRVAFSADDDGLGSVADGQRWTTGATLTAHF